MKHDSKLTLSDEELQLVNNTRWILTKHVITRKVSELFGSLAEKYKAAVVHEKLPLPVLQSTPKISRGENYLQLPYLLLDYPRYFSAENIFAVRTMFWWGNFFSVTLHLSGDFKKMYEQILCSNIELLKQENFYFCLHDDQWHHHFEENNYCPVNKFTAAAFKESVQQKGFIKLAVKFPLHKWNEMPLLLEKSFLVLLQTLQP